MNAYALRHDDVAVRDRVPDRLWHELLAEAGQDVLPTQTPGWRAAVCAHGWRDATRLYTWSDGVRVLVPMVRTESDGPVRYASWPVGWGVGGVLAAPGTVCADRARAVLRDLARLPAREVYLRPHFATTALWDPLIPTGARRNPRMTQVLDLTQGFDHVWQHRYRKKLRSGVRRGERSGLTVEHDGTGRLLPEFDRLFELSLTRWDSESGEPPGEARGRIRAKNPPSKFAAVAEGLGEDCRVWLARHEGRPVAGLVALYHGAYVVYWQAAMDKARAAPTCAAPYLLHLVVKDACARGAGAVHLGDTYPGTSVTRFKSAFGPDDHHTAGYWLPGAQPGTPTDRT